MDAGGPTGTNQHGMAVDLSGTVAVVVGASEGIGQAIAVGLARSGARVVMGGRDVDRQSQTADLARAAGGEAVPGHVDITSPASISDFAAHVGEHYGAPTILVNSAGAMVVNPAFEVGPDEWDLIVNTQLRGVFFTCQAFGRLMRDRGYGKIVNLSSTWAVTIAEGRAVYAAAKAGVTHLTTALAHEWAPVGIRVNAIAPTATQTPAVAARMADNPERYDFLIKGIPLGRLAVPEDLVGTALFLASSASDFITGETIFVDGGWRAAK